MEICVRCETPDTRNRFECVSADGDRMCGECIEEDNLLNGSDDGKARYAEILTGWSEEKADWSASQLMNIALVSSMGIRTSVLVSFLS